MTSHAEKGVILATSSLVRTLSPGLVGLVLAALVAAPVGALTDRTVPSAYHALLVDGTNDFLAGEALDSNSLSSSFGASRLDTAYMTYTADTLYLGVSGTLANGHLWVVLLDRDFWRYTGANNRDTASDASSPANRAISTLTQIAPVPGFGAELGLVWDGAALTARRFETAAKRSSFEAVAAIQAAGGAGFCEIAVPWSSVYNDTPLTGRKIGVIVGMTNAAGDSWSNQFLPRSAVTESNAVVVTIDHNADSTPDATAPDLNASSRIDATDLSLFRDSYPRRGSLTAGEQLRDFTSGTLIGAKDSAVDHEDLFYLARRYGDSTSSPMTPPVLTISGTESTTMSLWWTPVTGASSYQLQRRPPGGHFSHVTSPSATTTWIRDSGLQSDTLYTYRLFAFNALGNFTVSSETHARTVSSGWFTSGQTADIMLSGVDFNRTGGGLLFNHPRSCSTDGTRFFLSDGNNNRVLVWNTCPTANTPPDYVLGQPDLHSNDPGTGLNQMNWPGQVYATRTGKLLVADSYNDRILIWNTIPTTSGQAADLSISISWPWGVWSDGTRVAASATGASSEAPKLKFWNTFPTITNQAPSFTISDTRIGTPRTITSNGTGFIVGDHNAITRDSRGNFHYAAFPTDTSSAYTYFRPDPTDPNTGWIQGTFTSDSKLIMLGKTLYIWDSFPATSSTAPSVTFSGYPFYGGDGADVAIIDSRVLICEYNNNRVSVFDTFPSSGTQRPNFVVGSTDLWSNSLRSNYIITNPVAATNGSVLLVTSDFDSWLLGWNSIPQSSGTAPDWTRGLTFEPWDNELWGSRFAIGGNSKVQVWHTLPSNGTTDPDTTLGPTIGSVTLNGVKGVAMDDTWFYIADNNSGKIYVFSGMPTASSEPAYTFNLRNVTRLSSNGTYLAATVTETSGVVLYKIANFATGGSPVVVGGPSNPYDIYMPRGAALKGSVLFLANTLRNRVLIWNNVDSAYAGAAPSVVLGDQSASYETPKTGRTTFFWPASLAFDGTYLWVGEFKFSHRLLRFKAQ